MSAMVVVPTVLCDLCGQPARTWHVSSPPDAPWQVDLCDRHASDIRALRQAGRRSARTNPRRHEPAASPEYT